MRQIRKSTISKYLDALKGDVLSEKDILGLRRLLNLSTSPIVKLSLISSMKDSYNLEKDHIDKAINWLKETQVKKSGKVRRSVQFKDTERLTEILDNLKDLTFQGVDVNGSYLPIYKINGHNGNSISYCVDAMGNVVWSI